MRTAKISDLISCSINRTKTILFRPFQLRKWLTLLFIATLAGALSTGGRTNLGNRRDTSKEKKQTQQQTAPPNAASSAATQTQAQTKPSPAPLSPGVIGVLVILGLGVGIFFMWLSSRFEFIWLNAIIRNVSQISEPWRTYQAQGQSLFRTRLAVAAGSLIYLGIIGVWGYAALHAAGAFEKGYAWSVAAVFSSLGPLLFIVIPISIVAGFFLGFIGSFAAPLMLRDQTHFVPAWKKFWPLFLANPGDFVLFALINFLLRLLTAILEIIGVLAVVLVLLIAGLIVFGPLYLIFVSLLKWNVMMLILGVLLGIPFLIAAFLCFLSVRLPFAVFFRGFSLDYLSSHGADYVVI